MQRRSSSACSSGSPRRGSTSEIGLPPDLITGGVAIDQLLRRSRWPVLRRLGFHPGGDERSSLRGAGLEYSDVREYQPGDDPRTIEWNITARSDRPFVRESLPDRGLDAWLLVDITRSLDWGTARCLKRQLALEFSAVVGQLLIGRGNRVGALLFDDRVRSIIPPSAGRTALLKLIARMQRALSALAIRHEVVAAWVTDPREREIPDVGVVTFEDPESGEQILVDTRSAHLRARFQEAAAAQRETIRADLLRARAAIAELSTEAEIVPQLVAFIKQREAQRGHRAARASA